MLKFMATLRYKEALSIDTISLKKYKKLIEDIKDTLKESIYFRYEEGDTKFSDKLIVSDKKDIFDDSDKEIVILDIHSLDILWVCEYSGHDGSKEINAIEVIGSGVFQEVIKNLEKKGYSKPKKIEIDTPIIKR